jgi:abortive infection bacteriophage resistance protein
LSPIPPSSGSGSAGSPRTQVAFTKPWQNWADQLKTLETRGLVVTNRAAAEAFLSHVNYYRLSGYCVAFEQARHVFVPGTTIEQLQNAYDFDRALRDLITQALELVEVDLRTAIAYHFGRQYQAFGHTTAANFYAAFRHQDWLDKLHAEAQRSSEQFVQHFRATYLGFPDLPVWMVTEVMSFGALSLMYKGMHRQDQRAIAHRYGVQPSFLASWLHHLVYVRNVCAHHSRLWDRVWAIKPDVPPIPPWTPPALPGNDHLFVTLLILRRLMARCPSIDGLAARWKVQVELHLQIPPEVSNPGDRMGLPAQWVAHPLWV